MKSFFALIALVSAVQIQPDTTFIMSGLSSGIGILAGETPQGRKFYSIPKPVAPPDASRTHQATGRHRDRCPSMPLRHPLHQAVAFASAAASELPRHLLGMQYHELCIDWTCSKVQGHRVWQSSSPPRTCHHYDGKRV